MEGKVTSQQLLPHLFRLEYAKMTAVICRHFGLQHIEIAEDIASETFLKATEVWGVNGIPDNPTAWLYTVARNKTKDFLKRQKIFDTQVKENIQADERQPAPDIEFTQQLFNDSQLAMIFAVCNPANSPGSQICLALQILCGFSVEEIADAFLTKTETIKKRLLRARTNLRNDDFRITTLQEDVIQPRLDTVLRTLYLLFNEGYFSASNNHVIRKELCSEAIRLTLILTEHPLTNGTKVNALLALMCYQSSRLDARADEAGETILFEQQDKELWSRELIDKGNYYLVNACSGNEVSKYHLEAGIAYWHTTPTDSKKWEHILQLYNELILIEYSPMTALNRTFAFAKVYGYDKGIAEAEKLQLEANSYYHSLLGYLYAGRDVNRAISHYNTAIRLTKSAAEKKTLRKEVERLKSSFS
ncbi:RNA polymerase sigma factor [Chitinophaga filiformis]|uniref:RNA polymerase sigma-70 factor, ECF subfamily n=1 Tax=Chitinophaga filiformis TaxID=104663 RepID=A0A1G7HSR6_CHIFI|nr:sigma-70 family RNA polymerase sigma factor [Chitinophaga filiformis]SDF03537.1 RNA polymerase sigma-70 factor, ECF subfamily [Chitinophaga filiformis]